MATKPNSNECYVFVIQELSFNDAKERKAVEEQASSFFSRLL